MIEISNQSGVRCLRMCHGRVNAMDIEFCQALNRRLAEAAASDCRAVVLTGNERVFSAGIDLKRWLREDESYVQPFMRELEALFESVFCFPKPIISAINGPAVAGGCMVAAACDFRFIVPSASIGIPELRVGVPLPMLAIEIVRFVARPDVFQSVVNLGAMYAGQQAVDVGLADQTVVPEQLMESAHQLAIQMADIPPPAFWMTKRQCRLPALEKARRNRTELIDEFDQIWCAPETRSAVQSYVNERLVRKAT